MTNLGTLGFGVSLASLLSRFRYRALAVLRLIASGVVLAGHAALIFG